MPNYLPIPGPMSAPRRESAIQDHLTWLRLRGMRPNTITSRRLALRRLVDAVPDALSATEDDLDRWQRTLRITDRSRSNELSHVISFYRWCHGYGLIPTDPTRLLIRPKLPRGLPRPIGEDSLGVAIATATPRVRPWLILAAYAGLRACEIAQLERGHVQEHADPPAILVADGKGGRQRIVPASPVVLAALHAHGMPSRGVIFPRADGQPGANTAQRISAVANQHLHSVGIAETLHQLRHRFGSSLYQVSVDLRLVQEVMGHSSPETTAGYVAWSNAKAAIAVNSIS